MLGSAQDSILYDDEGSQVVDTMEYYTGTSYDEVLYSAAPDTSRVEPRSFKEDAIKKLKANPDLNYKQPPTMAESIWDRFWAWVGRMLDSFFDSAFNTNWGRVIVYALGLALLVVLIMMILKVNAFKVIYSGDSVQKYNVLDENIHEMNFEILIQQAIDEQDYKKGVRLLFLYALKLLADRQLIHWQPGKTNHEYVGELSHVELRSGLNDLSYYFDYAWYGNFAINQGLFHRAQNAFTEWRTKLK